MHRFICVAYDPSRPKRVNYFPVRLCEGPKKIESGNSQASAQHFQPSWMTNCLKASIVLASHLHFGDELFFSFSRSRSTCSDIVPCLSQNSSAPCKVFGDPENWALEFEFQVQDSRVPLTVGIQNPSSTDEESGSSYRNPRSTAWNSESKTVLRQGGQNENQFGQFCHKNYLHDNGKLTIVESSTLRPSCGLLILTFSFILLIFSKILAFQATLNLDYK